MSRIEINICIDDDRKPLPSDSPHFKIGNKITKLLEEWRRNGAEITTEIHDWAPTPQYRTR